jgi:hypothetical protein
MHDHIVHIHRDARFLREAVTEYLQAGLERGEAAIVIARPELRQWLATHFGPREDMRFLDAEDTLARFMRGGMPQWEAFREVIGGLIANARLRYPGVFAYGEMVDVLWQAGQQDAAICLEKFWNELGQLQTFSLFCAYGLDSLDDTAATERICSVHTRLVPARDHSLVDHAVAKASEALLEPSVSRILAAVGSGRGAGAEMPAGHAALIWLRRNMPHASEQVLASVRERVAAKAL